MPCYKCSNGKWKYGQEGNCQFDTLGSCEAAERAIHARKRRRTNELQTHEETSKEETRQDVTMAKKPPHEERERREEPGHKKKPKK
jgi:hypothetical protein